MTHRHIAVLVQLPLVAILAACTPRQQHSPHVDRDAELIGSPAARAVRVFNGRTGASADWSTMIAEAASADVVLIGEHHGHPLGLAAAAAIWQDVLTASPRAGLSMEFLERDEQSHIDDYLTGVTDAAGFAEELKQTDDSYPPGHRAMVNAAKVADRPVIAANAPRRYVRIARLDGYDTLRRLRPHQQQLFRIPDALPDSASRYRREFDGFMIGEGASPDAAQQSRLDGSFRSQSLWDWTMAESIARARDSGAQPVVHVVGCFHVDFGGGLIFAIEHIRPASRVVTLSFIERFDDTLAAEDRGRADYVIYAGPRPREPGR